MICSEKPLTKAPHRVNPLTPGRLKYDILGHANFHIPASRNGGWWHILYVGGGGTYLRRTPSLWAEATSYRSLENIVKMYGIKKHENDEYIIDLYRLKGLRERNGSKM